MNWASRRRIVIIGGTLLVLVLVLGAILFATLYRAPSCMDHTQDQKEEGIDCGGPCSRLCTPSVEPPSVTFVRELTPVPGRTDVIAYVENKNVDAAVHAAPFTIELYGADNELIAKRSGVMDIPPATTVPVYVPNFLSGYQTVAHAFLIFDDASLEWYRYTENRVIPKVSNAQIGGTLSAPRIDAMLTNPSAEPLYNVKVVATVFDTNVPETAISASQTVIPVINAQGTASAVFTWNAPFIATPGRVDVVPIIPLPPL